MIVTFYLCKASKIKIFIMGDIKNAKFHKNDYQS